MSALFHALAVIGAIVAVILFAIFASNTLSHASLLGWGLVSISAAIGCLALSYTPWTTWNRRGPV